MVKSALPVEPLPLPLPLPLPPVDVAGLADLTILKLSCLVE